MAEEKAVYAPGELGKTRGNLGNVDPEEAKRMAKILGGEVGVERKEIPKTDSAKGPKKTSKAPKRRIELVSDEEESILPLKKKTEYADAANNPDDDPSKPLKQNYFERLKMDRLASEPEFDIKTIAQIIGSAVSLLSRPADYVAHIFISKRLNEYYKRIETLVVSVRNMFPRNNLKRNEQMRKVSPFAYSVLDTIRYWNIERISSDIMRMQARPRYVKIAELSELVKAVYKPLFILEALNLDKHIKASFKLLYKYLYVENPMDAEKYQILIKDALGAYVTIRKDIHYLLYPLLMKLVSNKCLPYDRFFEERRNRIMAFLSIAETDILTPGEVFISAEKKDGEDQDTNNYGENSVDDEKQKALEAERRAMLEREKRAVEKGLQSLESLFPEAGWDKLADYPDLFPYFRTILDLRKGYELLAPGDPMLQFTVLARILEELLIGLRSASFAELNTQVDNEFEKQLSALINNWHDYIDGTFVKEYLARLSEYCNLLSEAAEARTSSFARRIIDEMHYAKRCYFLPHFHYTTQNSTTAGAFQKKGLPAVSREVKVLRKCLTIVAAEIEKAMKAGGAEANAPCEGITNPWKPYNFQVASPISRRLDLLLPQKKRTNASLVFFTLAAATVLDYFLNNPNSWAYNPASELVFRSIDGKGVIPQFGVDEKIDADAIFKQKMKERAAAVAPEKNEEKAVAAEKPKN
jgi:hypothetical protein